MASDPTNGTSGPAEEMVRRLLSAVAYGATDRRVDELIAAARAEAEGEIQAMLKSAIKATLLRRTVERLEGTGIELPPPGEAEAGRAEIAATDHLPPEPFSLTPPPETPRPPAPAPPPGDVGCYVYAITRAGPVPATADAITQAAGAGPEEGAHLQAVRYEDVQAIVSPVPVEEFARSGDDRPENDPQWLEAQVLAHDRVVKSALSAGPVIPCRFCTVVRGADDVRRLLAKNYDRIAETLAALDGKQEWGVKIYARSRPARDAGPPASESGAGAGGKAYLFARKRSTQERGKAERAERGLAEACHEALASAACEAATLPVRTKAAGRDGKLLLNGTYLVSNVPAFHAAVAEAAERYERQGLFLELTGPWPPYNFVRLDLSDHPTPEVAA